ncbi:hypothetical protein PIGHUM_02878 [Pigmentiphaga humi]|uniref:Uncharacterized protein n=1 Tax=Pigmentiphaga humi TaxID=2478468 RepID=A0A3P4B4E0_9BURK|nr:hypothetical protein [Pigmentiphaga humi]VCU70801.1 hypothetical protein PIGHUM_02878 [Pigmentiphaga humi]
MLQFWGALQSHAADPPFSIFVSDHQGNVFQGWLRWGADDGRIVYKLHSGPLVSRRQDGRYEDANAQIYAPVMNRA